MKPKILEELETVTTELLLLIAAFNQEQINLIPFENSWTAAQVADHLYKSYASVLHQSARKEYLQSVHRMKRLRS